MGTRMQKIPRQEERIRTGLHPLNIIIRYGKTAGLEEKTKMLDNTMKIGTEFTFRNPSLQFNMMDLADNLKPGPISEAGKLIDRWVKKINEKYSNYKSGGYRISARRQDGSQKYKGNISYKAQMVIFHFHKIKKDKNDTYNADHEKNDFDWAVNFDLDPNCIELQTAPIPLNFYRTHQGFIEGCIFQLAQEQGLVPDKDPQYGGGGHITIDWKTSFGGDVWAFVNFMILYTNHTFNALVTKTEDILVACSDITNAPFLFETEAINAFQAFREAYSQASDKQNLEAFVSAIQKEVYTHFAGVLADPKNCKKLGVPSEDVVHYQAINLEHLLDEANPRFEMRRFDAQSGVAELDAQVSILIDLMVRAQAMAADQEIPPLKAQRLWAGV